MSHLTKDQLKQLGHLAAIDLSEDELDHLGGQLEKIISFVGQLDECDVSDVFPISQIHTDEVLLPRSDGDPFLDSDAILENSQHYSQASRTIDLQTSTNR